MRILALAICLCLVSSFLYAETYTGSVENVAIETSKLVKGSEVVTPMGIKFEVVVKDSSGKEVARVKDYVATGTMTATEALNAVKNEVDLKTMELYSHIQGATEAYNRKAEIESYTKAIDKFTPLTERPNPQTNR